MSHPSIAAITVGHCALANAGIDVSAIGLSRIYAAEYGRQKQKTGQTQVLLIAIIINLLIYLYLWLCGERRFTVHLADGAGVHCRVLISPEPRGGCISGCCI